MNRTLRRRRKRLNQLKHKADPGVDITFACDVPCNIEATDGEGVPSVQMTAYTGEKLSVGNFQHPVIIATSGVTPHDPEQQPLLRDHDTKRPVGHGKPIVATDRLQVEGSLSHANEHRDEVIAAQNNGFRWQSSVGGRIPNRERDVDFLPRGKKTVVNGKRHEGPAFVVRAFLWKETSFVSLGADEGVATARIAASAYEDSDMSAFNQWLEAMGVDAEGLEDKQLTDLQAAHAALQAGPGTAVVDPPPEVDVAKITAAAADGARESVLAAVSQQRQIDKLFASYHDVMDGDKLDELRAKVEGGEVNIDAAHVQLLQASRSAPTSNVGGSAGDQKSDVYSLTIEAAMTRLAGCDDETIKESLFEAGANDKQVDVAMQESTTPKNRKAGIGHLVALVCEQTGHRVVGRIDDEDIRCAMAYTQQNHLQANFGGGFSTVSLPGILSRVANKAMLAAYAEADNGGVLTRIASITSTPDFKKFDRYRLTEAGVAELVPASGEIAHGTMMEEAYENQVDQYARIIAMTRKMMVNDDLNAFLQIPRLLGRQARHALEQIGITTLVNTPANAGAGTTEFFFGAKRGNQEPNYMSGAGTELSMDSLEMAYELFLNQVDADGKPIMIDPAILLVTNGDIVLARKLFNDTEFRFTQADTQQLINNQWQGMFRPEKSAYLHRLGASPSATQWYLLGNPSEDFSGIQVAFLNGVQTPQISSSDVQFNMLGMQWRVVYDFGVAMQDPRTIVKSAGA